MNRKISIITPSLNSGQYIERAIKSVLEQGYQDFEHIVVDGLSTDDTLAILKKYPHLKWISEKDSGQSNAMNKGFALSTGDIIVYLNADDYFLPGAFKAVIPYFENGETFVVGDADVVLLNGKKVRVTPKVAHGDILRHWIDWEFVDANRAITSFPNNPVQYFYLRDVQEACPFNENNHFTMDVEFLMEASSRYTLCKIDTVLGVYVLYEDAKSIVAANDYENYWTFENFSYIDRFTEAWESDKKRTYQQARQKGYLLRALTGQKYELEQALREKIKKRDMLIEEKSRKIAEKDDEILRQLKDLSRLRKDHALQEALMESIASIVSSSTFRHPVSKLKAYRKMLALFHQHREK